MAENQIQREGNPARRLTSFDSYLNYQQTLQYKEKLQRKPYGRSKLLNVTSHTSSWQHTHNYGVSNFSEDSDKHWQNHGGGKASQGSKEG